jgi:hypothetical protein
VLTDEDPGPPADGAREVAAAIRVEPERAHALGRRSRVDGSSMDVPSADERRVGVAGRQLHHEFDAPRVTGDEQHVATLHVRPGHKRLADVVAVDGMHAHDAPSSTTWSMKAGRHAVETTESDMASPGMRSLQCTTA